MADTHFPRKSKVGPWLCCESTFWTTIMIRKVVKLLRKRTKMESRVY